jgi:hypothetical protein
MKQIWRSFGDANGARGKRSLEPIAVSVKRRGYGTLSIVTSGEIDSFATTAHNFALLGGAL